jgi:type VI secretion system protein ImpF
MAGVHDRLQPALLDRLTDDDPGGGAQADRHRVMTKAELRQAVLRDLNMLFNAIQPRAAALGAYPRIADSVLNYGLPPLAGQLASQQDVRALESDIRRAIARFEPRILDDESLQVRALEAGSALDTHNVIEFEIHGRLWSQPVPIEILLRTQLDLEGGRVDVLDAAAMPPPKSR